MRAWPLFALAAVAVAVAALGLHRQLSLGWVFAQHGALQATVAAHPFASAAVFGVLYCAMVSCMIPGGVVMSTAAGLLFGVAAGTALTVVAVTVGSVVVLLAARSALRPAAERLGGARLLRLSAALDHDGISYLLAARLIPFAPFWLTNLAAGLTRIRVGPFAAVTALGIAPITVALTATGAGFGQTLAAGGTPDLGLLLRPEITLPLAVAALLSLVPVAWRQFGRAIAPRRPSR